MSVHKDLKTNTWFFRKRVQNVDGSIKNCKRSGFKTKKEALKAEVEFCFANTANTITISVLWNEYTKYRRNKVKASTLYSNRLIASKYILPAFGNRETKTITVSDISKWQEELLKTGLSIQRVNSICLIFSQLFDFGKTFYSLTDNPVKKIGSIKDQSIKVQKIDIWTKEEFELFIDKVNSVQYKTLFYTLYYTGMRIGEVLALTFEDVDLDNKIIYVNKTLSFGDENKKGYMVTAPKTRNGNRKIDLSSRFISIINDYLQYIKSNHIKYDDKDFLFGISKPLPKTTIGRIKNNACKEAGVKQIRIHDFRHTHASMLIEKGVDPLYVKERLGHDDISTTLNTYSHLFASRRKSIIETIEKL